MNKEQIKLLIKRIEESKSWEKIPTTVDGINIVKPPENNGKQSVLVEVMPIINGKSLKKKPLYLKSDEELESFINLLNEPKLKELLKVIDKYYNIHKVEKIEI